MAPPRKLVRLGVVLAALAAATAVLLPAPVAAQISGPCSATINGRSVARLAVSSGDAIRVGRTSTLRISMAARRPIAHYTITLGFRGRTWTIRNAAVDARSWTGTVAVSRYARFGPGLYTVRGTSTGPGISCSGVAAIEVA